jgi:hypothetical protein
VETKEMSGVKSVSGVPTPKNGSQAGIEEGDEGEVVVAVNNSDPGNDSPKLDAESEPLHREGGVDESGEDDRIKLGAGGCILTRMRPFCEGTASNEISSPLRFSMFANSRC